MEFTRKQMKWRRIAWQCVTVSLLLVLITLFVVSCGSKNNDPAPAAPVVTLISPETLKALIDSGVVNGTGTDRVVILDLQSAATYSSPGHIPGALQMGASLYQTRQEGPAKAVNMVLDGAAMDALVQSYGIDKDTTIVFTGGTGTTGSAGNYLSVTRAYWTFRYWGFPKEKLKLLDGINSAWRAAYSLETGPSPAVTASSYSVKNNAAIQTGLRASLSEMINLAEGNVANAVPVDMRSGSTDGSYAGVPGSTAGVFTPGSDFVVFEGHVKGAKAMNYTDMFDADNLYRFKSAADLAAMFAAIGIGKTINTHVY